MGSGQAETVLGKYGLTATEPERRAVCSNLQGPSFRAPCLLELSTGELTESEIYEPFGRYSGESVPEQNCNVMTFSRSGLPLFIDRMKEVQRCVVYLPEEVDEDVNPFLYCRDCREKLAKIASYGYVLLDLYDLDAIQFYPVEECAEYSIRGYSVSIVRNKEQGHLVVTNVAHQFVR